MSHRRTVVPRPKPSRATILAAADELKSWDPEMWREWGRLLIDCSDMEEDEFRERLGKIRNDSLIHLVRSGLVNNNSESLDVLDYIGTVHYMERGLDSPNPFLSIPE